MHLDRFSMPQPPRPYRVRSKISHLHDIAGNITLQCFY
jgi:hypothetical protein